MPFPNKVITCRALAPLVKELLGTDEPLTVLDIALHLQPERLRQSIGEEVARLERNGETILLAYGLCGRALEGVVAKKSTLVLSKVDDCVGMLLGSRQRHRQVLHENPGTYFLESHWLDTELNIFDQLKKDLKRFPKERQQQLLKVALKHYNRLALLTGKDQSIEPLKRCRQLAKKHDMTFCCLPKDLKLLDKLLHGPWDGPEFIVAPPGIPIPMF
ncbi:DUF1638 domain-containing protein [Dethiosulfatarculus sandiegensis]|uniref:DUF1638 domain-containing protein n=1 Tax=Dethiosulfatarculus sandiegensis TaxID=1429043 RepID=A0A0D2GEM6_9BACT|nr:DUF1638 domain-containing protein [Dethiosulfatarculus sandiegensis]KIX13412.1 hypothetical protein X474_14110 [Dethiosulfatarculus sandiegensis]